MIAFAYVGPGLGAGVIATVVGVLAAIFLGLFSLVWYPVKRLIRRLRPRHGKQEPAVLEARIPDEG